MDLLILADENGIVDMIPEAIAARTQVPIEMVKEALIELEKPDPRSRSHEEDGRRLIRIDPKRDWGWQIVNYFKYRNMHCEQDRKSYMRKYMRVKRSSKKQLPVNSVLTPVNIEVNKVNNCFTPASASVHSSSSSNTFDQIQFLKTELSKMYGRKNTCVWDNCEERLLVELVQRPDMKEELAKIQKFKFKCKPEYFPQSALRLLENWTQTIDRAESKLRMED